MKIPSFIGGVLLATMSTAAAPTTAPTMSATSAMLHVQGTKIVDEQGTEFRIHGINIPSLEWTSAGDHVEESIPVALDVWKANLIRVPMSQDRWFGKSPDGTNDNGEGYRKRIDNVVAQVAKRGKHVLLDLHWSDCNVMGENIGQHAMPDAISAAFWKELAAKYANNPAVLFDLYNEPIKATWEVWRDGGPMKETFHDKEFSYDCVGMQTLLDDVRATGAKNLIIAGGTGYASALDGILEHPLKDPNGNGVVYSDHFYPGWENVTTWEARVAKASETLPLVIGEFGGSSDTLPLDDPHRRVAQVLDVLKRHDWNWIAWCMHPGAAPCLISNWSYAPTPYFGALVKEALLGKAVAIPPRRKTAKDVTIFDDKLENQFQYWGDPAIAVLDNSSPVHGGKHSIKVTANAWGNVQLGVVPFDGLPYESIAFWINGGDTGGQKLTLEAHIMETSQPAVAIISPTAKQWTRCVITFKSLGIADLEDVKSFDLKNATDQPLSPFYLDDIELIGRK